MNVGFTFKTLILFTFVDTSILEDNGHPTLWVINSMIAKYFVKKFHKNVKEAAVLMVSSCLHNYVVENWEEISCYF